MTTQEIVQQRNGSALRPWAGRGEVRELCERLAHMMLPGGKKLNSEERLALAQASLIHGLDPFNGEIWIIPGNGVMIGVKGLRKKAREQVNGNFWIDFREISQPEERKRLGIPDSALAYEARLFDSENIRMFCETVERLTKVGIPWESVKVMVGDKPYTSGVGFATPAESGKMTLVQRAMKRAEADALKRRFDVPFGLAVEESDGEFPGEWVEGDTRPVDYTDPDQVSQAIEHEKIKRDQSALFPE